MAKNATTTPTAMSESNSVTIGNATNHTEGNAVTFPASNGAFGSPVAPVPVAIVDFGSPIRPDAAERLFVVSDIKMSPRQKNLSNISKLESKFEEGYDSDGQEGPWCNVLAIEGEQDFEEGLLIEQTGEEKQSTSDKHKEEQVVALPPLSPPPAVHISIKEAVLMEMKVDVLKNELKIRGQSGMGKKGDLQERLKIIIKKKLPVIMHPAINKNTVAKRIKKKLEPPKGMKSFPTSAYWRVLQPRSEAVVEPENPSFKFARSG